MNGANVRVVLGADMPLPIDEQGRHVPIDQASTWPCPTRPLADSLVRSIEEYARAHATALSHGADPELNPKVYVQVETGTLDIGVPYGFASYCIFVQPLPSGLIVTLRYLMTAVE